MRASRVIKYTLSLAVAGIFMYFAFRNVEWGKFVAGLKNCRWGFIAASMAASVAACWFRSERWRILISPFDKTLDSLSTFNGVNIGYLANFAFPRIGEVVRCGLISRRSRSRHTDNPSEAISFDRTLGTVLLSRVWDVIVSLIILAVLLVAKWRVFGDFFVNRMWAPFREHFDFSLWWLIGAAALMLVVFIRLCHTLRDKNAFFGKCAGFAEGIFQGFKSCLQIENKTGFFIHTALLWTMYWLMSFFIILAIPEFSNMMGPVDALFVCMVGSIGWAVPVPGGFGSYHGIVALALSTIYMTTWNEGLLFATLDHESQMITMVVCGIVSYIIETLRK